MKEIYLDTTEESSNWIKRIKPYWVYIDRPTKNIRMHNSECKFCNNGRGIHGHNLPNNWWKGFNYREEAWEYAKDQARMMLADPKTCGYCCP